MDIKIINVSYTHPISQFEGEVSDATYNLEKQDKVILDIKVHFLDIQELYCAVILYRDK